MPEAVADGVDFSEMETLIAEAEVDLIFGSSRCAPVAARQGIPLLRVGMPIHDRVGAQRVLHVGYRGTQALFDAMVNTLLQVEQDRGDAGYMTM
jgi:nitrogenase molybdenum-iron protein NifN